MLGQKMAKGYNFKHFTDEDFLNLFYSLRKKYGIDFLANKFNLNNNTIVRWVNNNSIPSQYYLDCVPTLITCLHNFCCHKLSIDKLVLTL